MDFSPPLNMNQHHPHQMQTHAHHYQTPHTATSPNIPFPSSFRPQPTSSDHALSASAGAQQTPNATMNGNGQSTYYDANRSTASPRTAHLTPNTQTVSYSPSTRTLPSRDFVSDQEFEDTYVAFILYCNPAIPADVNTHDLRKNFASPPRSDNKTFNTRRLYELIQQLDSKKLKTWTELALELGVERPAIDKGQSSQKVQQYSVRLKRWLRASHIDAFFDYMMGKPHKYLELPPLDQPFPEQRDGVFVEDDLALRALKPEFRPKRGRKRAESDEIEPMSAIEPKRPHLDMALALSGPGYPHSAYPGSMSAHPDDLDRIPGDHWVTPPNLASSPAVAKTSGPTTMRWRLNEIPTTPNPMSAVTPISALPPDSALDDATSHSQKMRMRRRHGTAVSSAWPSNSTTPNGKLRGRPPTNRSVKDGPFISFPANPKAKEGPPIDLSKGQVQTPTEEGRTPLGVAPSASPNSPFRVPAYPTPISAVATAKIPGRPERLSLQVPQHVGNPVRLVTPTVVVNGEEDHHFHRSDSAHSLHSGIPRRRSDSGASVSVIGNEDLKRALAADLLKADVTGRRKSLRGTEAKDLAESLLINLRSRITSPLTDGHNAATDETFLLTCASWLGLNPPPSSATKWNQVSNSAVKKIHVRRFRVNEDGYDIPIDDSDDEDSEQESGSAVKQTFDIEWELSLGAVSGKFQIKGLLIGESPSLPDRALEDDDASHDMSDSWRQKYLTLQAQLRDRNDEIQALKDKVLDAVL